MLQLAFVGGLTGEYVDFTTAQHAALRMLAERTGRALSDDDARGVVDAMSSLPPQPEVGEALTPFTASAARTVVRNAAAAMARVMWAYQAS
jgi:2-haloacid dehalogenase